MSFLDFNEDQYIKTLDTNEKSSMGSFQTIESGEIYALRILIYINDIAAMAGNEQIRVNIYSDYDYLQLLYTSNWTNIADIALHDETYGTTQGWYGWLATYFNEENISNKLTYYLEIETNNYTRTSSRYIGLGYDYPFPVYGERKEAFNEHPLAFELYMYFGDR